MAGNNRETSIPENYLLRESKLASKAESQIGGGEKTVRLSRERALGREPLSEVSPSFRGERFPVTRVRRSKRMACPRTSAGPIRQEMEHSLKGP